MIDIINDNFNDLAKDYYKLQEEYEQLQQENKQLKEEYVLLQNASDEVEDKLQQRIDKALNYIHIFSSEDNNFCLDYHELNELKKLLKGDKI